MPWLDAEHRMVLAERAMVRVEKMVREQCLSDDQCWIWPGGKSRGYAYMMSSHHGQIGRVSVRRVIYAYLNSISYNSVPKMRASCGNKLCMNRRHWIVGRFKP